MRNVFQCSSCPVSSWSESSASGLRPRDKAPKTPLNPVAPTYISTRPLSHPPLPLGLFHEMGSFSDKSDEKRGHLSVDSYQVDTGAQLVSGVDSALDQAESLRIRYVGVCRALFETHNFEQRRKIDRHILPLMCSKCRNLCRLLTPEEHFPSTIWVRWSPIFVATTAL